MPASTWVTIRDVSLPQIAWLATVVLCVVTAGLLLLYGYVGYAAVTLAVAAAAAINIRGGRSSS